MPNRIIKESIKRSPEIDKLSWFEEVVFYRLLVTADDYGRMDGRIIVLKNDLFPTKETVTKKAIEDAISKLVSVGLLIAYVDAESNMPLLAFKKWEKHQTIRNKFSRYPAPSEGSAADCNQLISDCKQLHTDCNQLISDCNQSLANCTYESESNIESESNKEYESEGRESNARKRFSPPKPEQVEEYCLENGYDVDAHRFVDFYASKGWKVGGSPMKDWKAAVRTWVSREKAPAAPQSNPAPSKPNPALDYDQREYTKDDFGKDFFIDLERYSKEGASYVAEHKSRRRGQ